MASLRIVAIACLAGAVSLAGTASAGAQGPGRHGPPPVAPGQAKKPSTTTTTGSPAASNSSSTPVLTEFQAATRGRLQTFGTWLDNADVNAPGEAWMSISTAYWRSSSLREIDAPAMGISIGVAPRVQLGVSLPYYHVTDPSGFTSHGLGASYVTGKIALTRDTPLGASISPTLEILSWSSPGINRVNWMLPVSVQADTDTVRFYGTGGYVSRGSVFGSGAAEWSAGSRLTLVATVAHSYSVANDPVSDALDVTRHRTDASGGVYLRMSPSLVVFANAGRTLAPVDDTSARLSLTGGIAVNVAGPATRAPRLP